MRLKPLIIHKPYMEMELIGMAQGTSYQLHIILEILT